MNDSSPRPEGEPIAGPPRDDFEYGPESEYSAGIHALGNAVEAQREAIATVMAEHPDMTEAQAKWEVLHQLAPEEIVNRRAMERQLDVDDKTGVGSDAALQRALVAAERDPDTAFISFDLNNFGEVNKIYSQQEEGDVVLKEAAIVLQEAAHDYGQRVFRRGVGADEFVVIAPKAAAAAIRDRAERLFGERTYIAKGADDRETGRATVSLSGTVNDDLRSSQEGLQQRKQARKAQHGQSDPTDV